MSNRPFTQDQFLEVCKKIHNNKYDYSLVEYTGSHDKIKLICPKHGIIEILPYNHLNNKRGCKACGLEKTHIENKVTLDEIFLRSNKIKEYKLVEPIKFNKLTDKIELICKNHGNFKISIRALLRNF